MLELVRQRGIDHGQVGGADCEWKHEEDSVLGSCTGTPELTCHHSFSGENGNHFHDLHI